MARKAEPIPASDTIGSRLRSLREEHEMTLAALAEKLGCIPQTIRTWEKDMYIPCTYYIILYSDIFGVSTDWILKGKEHE